MRFTFTFDTDATPQQALDSLVDFTPRRLRIWKGTLQPSKYEVREVGDGWAIATEGSPGFWVLLRYEWEPGHVHWSVLDSNYCRRGTGDVTITPIEGGGARVATVMHHRDGKGLRGRVNILLQGVLGPRLFPIAWKAAMNRVAAQAHATTPEQSPG